MFLQPNDSPVNLLIHFEFSFLHRFRFACPQPERVPVSCMRVYTCDNIVHNLDINICGKRREKSLDLEWHDFRYIFQVVLCKFLSRCVLICVFRVIRNKLWIKFISTIEEDMEDSIRRDYLKILKFWNARRTFLLFFFLLFFLRVQLLVNDIFTARLKFLTKVFQSCSRSIKLVYSKFLQRGSKNL